MFKLINYYDLPADFSAPANRRGYGDLLGKVNNPSHLIRRNLQ